MLRLFGLVLVLTFVPACVIVTARLIGEVRPSPLAILFTNSDGSSCDRSCLFGIVPGKTESKQAHLVLESHRILRNATWATDRQLSLADPADYIAFSDATNGIVDTISLTASQYVGAGLAPAPGSLLDSIDLGDLILTFGIPDAILKAKPYTQFVYSSRGFFAYIVTPQGSEHLQARTPLSGLILGPRDCSSYADDARLGVKPQLYLGAPWKGFTFMARYTSDFRARIFTRGSGLQMPPYAACLDS